MNVSIYCRSWYPGIAGSIKEKESRELERLSEKFFKDKSYCEEVEEYEISWKSIPPDWMAIYKPLRPRYIADKTLKPSGIFKGIGEPIRFRKYLDIYVLVDYEEYVKQTTKVGGWNVIGKAVLSYLREMKYPVVLRKVFDCERFNSDMEAFFRSLGCSID